MVTCLISLCLPPNYLEATFQILNKMPQVPRERGGQRKREEAGYGFVLQIGLDSKCDSLLIKCTP